MPAAHASKVYGARPPAVRPRRGGPAAPGRRAGAAARGPAHRRRPREPRGPSRPSCTSPPAAAPTASVAMTGRPWFMASLTTRPHGSRKPRVGIDGRTRTSEPAYKLRSCRGSRRPARTVPGGASGPGAGEHERRALEPGAGRTATPRRGRRAPSQRSRRPANKAWNGARPVRSGRRGPEGVVDRLGRLDHPPAGAFGAHVGRDVRAVGHHRVGVGVDPAQRRVGEHVGRRAGVRPDRGPQDEGHPGPAGAEVGRRQREPAGEPGDHGPVAARAGQARRSRAPARAARGARRARRRRRRAAPHRRRARTRPPRAPPGARTPGPGSPARGS